ncbi:MAG: BtrH N-terminal domain-containing protein [Lachnospiraceae bacterium]
MKPYIRPRVNGVKKLEWYIEGFERYLSDVSARTGADSRIRMDEFSGEHTYEEARAVMKEQLDAGFPVPYLMLRHKMSGKYKDFIWHWFLVVGYEEAGEDFHIIAATYGEKVRLLLKELWNTGYEEKGGVILYRKRAL